MALVVGFIEVAHHQLGAFLFREAHQAHNFVYALIKVPVGFLVPVAPVSRVFIPLWADGNIRAHPVYDAAFDALLLGGNPDGFAAIIMGVETVLLAADGVIAASLRVPETVVHQSVVVRNQACGHSIVVVEGGGGE
jgi:hypothetical protein